ncbi:MAG: beta-N-acetylhexosaminidase [Bacteroidales bacterium]|nr:beta-N-acetylhexosaminidase [Bacteroidales bacterium]MDD4822194.1 beta-N-acetylhexosaminidase [Bacteroidales bacterium]
MKRNVSFKKCFTLVICLTLFFSGDLHAQRTDISVLPLPKSIQPLPSDFVLKDGNMKVYLDKKASLNVGYITSILEESGLNPEFVKNEKKATLVVKQEKKFPGTNEAYQLTVLPSAAPEKVTITANSKEGLLYGMQTLRQLTKKNNGRIIISGCTISDTPQFPWRAFMLDESRHFQGIEVVKGLLDEMARLKMNTFHWHLVDDPGWRIEIKKYPELTSVGSKRDYTTPNLTPQQWDSAYATRKMYYTQDEIREVVKYAGDRGIKIIPEIEVPGHASASIAAYPWLGSSSRKENKAVWGDLYNVTDPKVEAFIHNVLDEVIKLFPSKIVHIGGDEANYSHWQNSEEVVRFMKENNIPTFSDLQLYANNRLSAYLASKGCRMIGWNEITGDNIRGEANVQASQSEKLAPGTIVQFWDGEISLVNKAIAKGYDVVNSNRMFTYLDYTYDGISFEKAYSFNPVPEGVSKKDQTKIYGFGCQMWGEFTPNTDRLYYQTFPRIAALAECGWTPYETKNYTDFRERFKKIEVIWKEKGYLKTQLDKY